MSLTAAAAAAAAAVAATGLQQRCLKKLSSLAAHFRLQLPIKGRQLLLLLLLEAGPGEDLRQFVSIKEQQQQ